MRRSRAKSLVAIDAVALSVGLLLGLPLRLGYNSDDFVNWGGFAVIVLAAVFAQGIISSWLGVYRGRWRVASDGEVVALLLAAGAAGVVAIAVNLVLGKQVPTTALVAGSLISVLLVLGSRVFNRLIMRANVRRASEGRRAIVFGAGEAGESIIRQLQADNSADLHPVAVLDDDTMRQFRSLAGVPGLGNRSHLERVAAENAAEVLLIAMPTAEAATLSELNELGKESGLEVLTLPPPSELFGSVSVEDFRALREVDLLGRHEVEIDYAAIREYIDGRRVLVTGAGGSIGSELCRQLSKLNPSELYMLDRDESALHGVQLSIEGRALLDSGKLIVADIRDRNRITGIFNELRPDVVFHTAALKHLTLLEQHPGEGFKTNALGSLNLLEAAEMSGVSQFVNVSTDKAADPTSILGATKRMAEIFTSASPVVDGRRFLSVRFGNVLGSRGSVLPTFRQQIEDGGPLTVTHPDVTRFFMTIPEAVRLVLQAGAIGTHGETLVLDMGSPVKIIDLANRLIEHSGKDIDVEFTGLRPGEKMHEVLFSSAEVGLTRKHPRVMHTLNDDSSAPADVRMWFGYNDERIRERVFLAAGRDSSPKSVSKGS